MKIFVINGPNLNLLGEREPTVYGSLSLNDINDTLRAYAGRHSIELEFFQGNSEGEIINVLHRARKEAQGVIINPGGYSHTSVAILDAINASELPVVEVHISNVHKREEFRQNFLTARACRGVITGFGAHGYILALEALREILGS